MAELDTPRVLTLLNRILEQELAGVIRYTHYSLLVYGYNRIPIIGWLREQADESLGHAQRAGEMVSATRQPQARYRPNAAGVAGARGAGTRFL
jgi:bacterioferritin